MIFLIHNDKALDFLNRGKYTRIKGQRPCFRDDEPFSEEFKGRARQRGLVRQTTKNEATQSRVPVDKKLEQLLVLALMMYSPALIRVRDLI